MLVAHSSEPVPDSEVLERALRAERRRITRELIRRDVPFAVIRHAVGPVAAEVQAWEGTLPLDGLEALTAAERRVCRLVAAGARNAEVADALRVSPRTVEHHLTRSYRKLEVRSRTELAARLR